MMDFNKQKIKELEQELAKQAAIFQKYAPAVINPSNSPAYKSAKKKFDAADKRIKEIEKELDVLKHPADGIQSQPSQSKVKL